MATYIYARVSTAQQQEGQSLDAQRETCRAYLELLKQKGEWKDDSTNIAFEQCSGSMPFRQREKGKVLWEKLKRGDTLVAAKLDRVWRSASDAIATIDEFKKRGVTVHLVDLNGNVTTDGISQLVFNILAAVAAWERSRIGERTREAKREAARQGYFVGGRIPWDKTLLRVRGKVKVVENDQRAAIVKKLRQWRTAGVPLRECQQRVKKLGEQISTDAIRRLTFGFTAAEATKRGRRKVGERKR